VLFRSVPSTALAQSVWYVNADAGNDNNSGQSWDQAFSTLTKAISTASAGSEIWVARGVYKPGTGVSASETFTLKEGVKIYGGFAGNESSLAYRTDWKANASILDGSNKSYHVVTGSNLTNAAALDG